MKYSLLVFTFIILSLFAGSKTPSQEPVPSWQQSEALNIQIGVRDKNGTVETYDALFRIEDGSGKTIAEKTVSVNRDEWGFIYFPENFDIDANDGEYTWKCFSKNVEIARGHFTYSERHNTLKIPEKSAK